MPVSSWSWKDRWWTSEKVTWNGNDATAQAGAILVPWAADAKPVTEARQWDIEYIYTAAAASQVTIAQNLFREPGEAGNAGQESLATSNLAPGTRMVLTVRMILHKGLPLWTPQFSIPDGKPPVTFHRIAAWPAQVEPTPKPAPIRIRSQASGFAVGGGGVPLSCQSQAGDIAILMMASQWGNTSAHAPTGWTAQHSSDVGGRSGFIAALKVTDPAQTQNVAWTGATASAARERAALAVLTGAEDFTLHGWQTTVPEISKLSLLVSQQHGAARGGIEMWTQDIQSGAHSDARSWSVLLAGLVDKAPSVPEKDAPQAWAWVDLTPAKAPTPPPTDTVELTGETEPGRVRVLTDAEEIPARMAAMPAGYASVDTMLNTHGFAVAHRGGSLSWPEASMRAYTAAVAHGIGALEISCQQTADGVWVLNHDQTLKRVDPTAPNTPVTQMTWAQIQTYRTQGEPFARIEQVLNAYASSHVIVLDPKYSAANWRALAALLPEGAKDRVIWKFSVDATWLARQWVADGWRCWGYSYPEHVTSDQLKGWQEPWTCLGMSWDASKEVWDKTLAFGKPVWGHICPTATAYATALGKGAVGCMVSGVASLYPSSV
jgi:hypothetical protein